jgi:hypothetical protein
MCGWCVCVWTKQCLRTPPHQKKDPLAQCMEPRHVFSFPSLPPAHTSRYRTHTFFFCIRKQMTLSNNSEETTNTTTIRQQQQKKMIQQVIYHSLVSRRKHKEERDEVRGGGTRGNVADTHTYTHVIYHLRCCSRLPSSPPPSLANLPSDAMPRKTKKGGGHAHKKEKH